TFYILFFSHASSAILLFSSIFSPPICCFLLLFPPLLLPNCFPNISSDCLPKPWLFVRNTSGKSKCRLVMELAISTQFVFQMFLKIFLLL
ncbi:hypothetical protein ES288_D07G168600v1, partial [Gossypium darwinii]